MDRYRVKDLCNSLLLSPNLKLPSPMLFQCKPVLSVQLLILLSVGCHSNESRSTDVEIVVLEDYETVIDLESDQLAVPIIIKYDDDSDHLFIYDSGHNSVFEIDLSSGGNIINEFGRQGEGPGEYQHVNSILLVKDYLYLVDHLRQYIHKYDRNGSPVSSMNYGAVTTGVDPLTRLMSAMTVMLQGTILEPDINHQPFVTLKGHVLLRPDLDRLDQTIYELRDWEGNHLSDIGEVPDGSMFMFMPEAVEEYESAVLNRRVPSIFKPYAFPVHDRSNPEEYFLVYSAIPIVAKYQANGEKLWENKISGVRELEDIADDYFESMGFQLQQQDGRTSIGLRVKYTSGVSSPGGDLYLATSIESQNQADSSELPEPLWIHRFGAAGDLDIRYKVVSEDVGIASIFDIDFTGDRLFIVTSEGEIRAYQI